MGRIYVISGATGMTGNELVRQILAEGKDDFIIGFDNFFCSSIETVEDCLGDERFVFYEYDLNDEGQMGEIEKLVVSKKDGFEEIVYINCAAVVHTEHFYHVYETYETNVVSMNLFLEQAIRVGAKKFINCSTSEIYSMNSWNEHGGVEESDFITMSDAEHSQRTSYACGKMLTEFFMKDAVDEGKILGCSIRFANVYSRNELQPKHIVPHIISSLKNDGKVVLLENSKKNRRTFLNNYDSCSAVLALVNTDSALDGTIYNVATDEEMTIVDLVKLCASKMGIEDPLIEFEGYRENDPERRLLSTKKIRERTGWEPAVSLDQGIEEAVRYRTGSDAGIRG
ncbi:MAG: NAD(P)-dependent oxidoreductase [Eubacterium sp.]|nr:NAD(P)-dependent oxidoreductase [Eubacterium sp.]